MVLYFHFDEFVFEYPLPVVNDRRISLNLSEKLDRDLGTIHLEVWDGVWHIISTEMISLFEGTDLVDDLLLETGSRISGFINDKYISFSITIYALDESYIKYKKYSIFNVDEITIGSGSENLVVVNDQNIELVHAVITKKQDGYYINNHSTLGTFVSDFRVIEEYKLEIMDVIYITGMKIVFMDDFIAVNRYENCQISLHYYKPTIFEVNYENEPEYLVNSPRILEPVKIEPLEIEAPPQPQKPQKMPLIFSIGPALTMPIPILLSTFFNMQRNQAAGGGNNSFMFGALITVLASTAMAILWGIANKIYAKSVVVKGEKERVKHYKKYIEENEEEIVERQKKNDYIVKAQQLSLNELSEFVRENSAVIWNRNINQKDFLSVRIGQGFIKFESDITVPSQRFSMISDELQSLPHELKEKYEYIPDSVAFLPLHENKLIGVIGQRGNVRSIAKVIAMQLATTHSYLDVKLAFILRDGEEEHYSWAKPLPHTRLSDQARLICATETQRQNVLYQLNTVMRTRKENSSETASEKIPIITPHFIIFCTDPQLISGENMSQIMTDSGHYGATFVLLYETADKLPNACNYIFQWDDNYKGRYKLDSPIDKTNIIEFEEVSNKKIKFLASRISGFKLRELIAGEIPNGVSFFDMHNIKSIANWDLLKKWKENRAYESMKALVGIGNGGKPVYLDIHEKQHGPHGLVAGTTGSGKSETIQTYILSLVMNFHPHEISLILIDYKGGGMANAFLDLPHLAGTITNLDSNEVHRALVSIKAEIKRRQTLFNQFNVNHIDNYSRYFREGTAKEPLPHLIIISDEFAELKKEQPEFIKELVSTARVGRSLGVHLILATQKPSGVVDDEIWSNSRFKLCLRVQDKQDSNEMLHKPDAAYLTNIGRAYMQIGNDEIFELFQSGYSGAYYEEETDDGKEVLEVEMIDLDGSKMMFEKKENSGSGENRPTQLSVCVDFIRQISNENNIMDARPLWLPPVKEGITLGEVNDKYAAIKTKGITATIGVVDNPYIQTQIRAQLDFSTFGHLLIAGIPGTGKSTLIQTMLYSLVSKYSPEEVIFYCIDFSSTLTRVFSKLPHCGSVIYDPSDDEKIKRLFQLLQEIMKERNKFFDNTMVGSFEEFNQVAENKIPMIIVTLDNLYAFNDAYPDYVDEYLLALSHTGTKFGIHLVVAVNHMNDIKYKLRQNFDRVVPLTLTERGDYHDALGIMPTLMPSGGKGQGLWGKEALEFQGALAVKGDNEKARAERLLAEFKEIKHDSVAPRINVIPKDKIFADIINDLSLNDEIFIAYQIKNITPVTLNLKDLYCYAVSSSSRKAIDNMFANLSYSVDLLENANKMFVSTHYEPSDKFSYEQVFHGGDGVFELLKYLKEDFSQRSKLSKVAKENNYDVYEHIKDNLGLKFIFIDSMNEFLNIIYDVHDEDYYPLMELFFKQGKQLGIYFVAGFESSVYSTNMYKEAYKIFALYKTGIHLGGKLDQQKLFDVPYLNREAMQTREISDGVISRDDELLGVYVPLHELDKE